MINFIRHTAATDMYRKQDRRNKHIQLENIKKKTRPKNISYGTVHLWKKTKDILEHWLTSLQHLHHMQQ